MGGVTSKQLDDAIKVPKSAQATPKQAKILPFDPRSPSEHFPRTPIAVTNSTEPDVKATPVKVLPTDPRSPSGEVVRTPIVVENLDKVRPRHLPLKPSKLAAVPSSPENTIKNNTQSTEQPDPRSPTIKVPRTPLEYHFNESTTDSPYSAMDRIKCNNLIKDIPKENNESKKENIIDKENIETVSKKLFQEVTPVQMRRPLGDVLNTSHNIPKHEKVSKQDSNIEDEFNKSQQTILSQLIGDENTGISTSTEFVEDI